MKSERERERKGIREERRKEREPLQVDFQGEKEWGTLRRENKIERERWRKWRPKQAICCSFFFFFLVGGGDDVLFVLFFLLVLFLLFLLIVA